MNARVLLLVLVTALFMSAWTGDQAAMRAATASRDHARTSLVAKDPAGGRQGLRYLSAAVSTAPETVHEASDATGDDAIRVFRSALPEGLATGRYKAVSDRGMTHDVVIDDSQATGSVARDLFITDAEDGSRWYLIRQRNDQ